MDPSSADASPSEPTPPAPLPLPIGAAVQLLRRPEYLKTADPMPMLRPPDLVDEGEVGQVVGQRSLGQLAVRFRRGTFLLGQDQLTASAEQERPRG
jgi:hypothetical protein